MKLLIQEECRKKQVNEWRSNYCKQQTSQHPKGVTTMTMQIMQTTNLLITEKENLIKNGKGFLLWNWKS